MGLEMTISLDIFNSWNDSRQTALHCTCSNMLQPRFQTQVVVRWICLLAGSRFKMATLEIRLKRVNKIYFEGVSGFSQNLSLNSCT